MSMGSLAIAEEPISAQPEFPANKMPAMKRRIVAKRDAVERPEAR
jgi:hypothetical protein